MAVSWESIEWRDFDKIVISGPQRSGTTFFAKTLASILGYMHADENAVVQATNTATMQAVNVSGSTTMDVIAGTREKIVLQRPQHSHLVHDYPVHKNIFVAFMARNCLDVFRSQNRIMTGTAGADTGWTCAFGRKIEWGHYNADPELSAVVDDMHDMICTIKQQAYLRHQRAIMDKRGIAHAAISFHSLSSMKEFVPDDTRKSLHLRPKELPP